MQIPLHKEVKPALCELVSKVQQSLGLTNPANDIKFDNAADNGNHTEDHTPYANMSLKEKFFRLKGNT